MTGTYAIVPLKEAVMNEGFGNIIFPKISDNRLTGKRFSSDNSFSINTVLR